MAAARQFALVRFTLGPLGLVSEEQPYKFVERTVKKGDEGLLLLEGDPPFELVEGQVLVKVDELWCPVDPSMIENVTL